MDTEKSVEAEVIPVEPKAEVPSAVLAPKTNAGVRLGTGVLFASMAEVFGTAEGFRKGGAGPKNATTGMIAASIIKGLPMGLDPVTAYSNITIVNGRASIMGDLALGIVRRSGLMKLYRREWIGVEGEDDYGCKITMARKDTGEEIDYTFTFGEAKRAGLCRTAMWVGFLKRMLYYRTLGFILRDLFSDVTMGLYLTEELQGGDYFDPSKKRDAVAELPATTPAVDPFFVAPAEEAPKALEAGTAPETILGLDLAKGPDQTVKVLIPVVEPMAVKLVGEAEAMPLTEPGAPPADFKVGTVEAAITVEPLPEDDTLEAAAEKLLAAVEAGTLKRDDEIIAQGLGPSGVANAPDDPFRGFRDEPAAAPVVLPAKRNPRRRMPAAVLAQAPQAPPVAPPTRTAKAKTGKLW
jgi:hypothetical protein